MTLLLTDQRRRIALLDGDRLAGQRLVPSGSTAAEAGDNPEGLTEVEVERFGEAGEVLVDGRWQRDPEAHAAAVDAAFLADHGALALATAYAAKELEARLIVAGLSVEGRIAAEARLRGVAVEALARRVLARADAAALPERLRIAAKLAGGQAS